MSESPDFDAQDNAETFDETTLDGQSQRGEMRTFEELPDLLDLTQAEGDRDDDEALALDADEFDEDAIVGFSDLSRGRDILTTANTIIATYLSPTHDYQATDAQPWVDDDDVAARGEIISDKAFNMAPSHGQARRLMKLAAYRASPNWVGSFQCNMRGLAAFGERFIRIK